MPASWHYPPARREPRLFSVPRDVSPAVPAPSSRKLGTLTSLRKERGGFLSPHRDISFHMTMRSDFQRQRGEGNAGLWVVSPPRPRVPGCAAYIQREPLSPLPESRPAPGIFHPETRAGCLLLVGVLSCTSCSPQASVTSPSCGPCGSSDVSALGQTRVTLGGGPAHAGHGASSPWGPACGFQCYARS